MALASILSMLESVPDFKTLEGWLWDLVAAKTREQLTVALAMLDEVLMQKRPAGLRHQGSKRRVVATMIGAVEIRRRRYLEVLPTGERRWRYLLDEALGLPAEVRSSPGLVEEAVVAAVQGPYRGAAAQVAARRPDGAGPSHGTIHRWVSRSGQERVAREAAQVRALFEDGVVPPTSGECIEVLFAEADEVRVALQRAKRRRRPGQGLPKRRARRGEVRVLVCHRGWERRHPGSEEYRLQGKHRYAAVAAGAAFWRGATLSLHGYCALEQVEWSVLNGDGAAWIRQGLDYLPACEFQLDRWHLQRAIKVGLGWHRARAQEVRAALEGGAGWEAVAPVLQHVLQEAPDPEKRAAVRHLHRYLWENRDGLRDYRQRGLPVPREAAWRGLGAAESNVDKPWARRLTKQGMSWGRGLPGLVRLLNLHLEGTLPSWLEVNTLPCRAELHTAAQVVPRPTVEVDKSAWLHVDLPALAGPRTSLHRTLHGLKQERPL